jgi:hypothetical protein
MPVLTLQAVTAGEFPEALQYCLIFLAISQISCVFQRISSESFHVCFGEEDVKNAVDAGQCAENKRR